MTPPWRMGTLRADEVHGLDAVGALVDLGDLGVAVVLGDAGLLDVAHAAVDLDADRRDLLGPVGAEALHQRREQLDPLVGRGAVGLVGLVPGPVDLRGLEVAPAPASPR